jgi:outer membrane protein assembly factor BamB
VIAQTILRFSGAFGTRSYKVPMFAEAKKSNLIYGILFFVCFFIILRVDVAAESVATEREIIASADINTDVGLACLNDYIIKNDVLGYLAIRQRLLSLSADKLRNIKEKADQNISLSPLSRLVENLCAHIDSQSIYNLREDIFVNNRPELMGHPFYGNNAASYSISKLIPQAEYLYFNNLKLPYRKNHLVNLNDRVWQNPSQIKRNDRKTGEVNHDSYPFDYDLYTHVADQALEIWKFRLEDDHLNDFFYDPRQWLKKYEEPIAIVARYRDTVILRNEYRLFCLDNLTGQELWSFGNARKPEEGCYQTFRRPHENSYGYDLLVSGSVLFSKLGERLVGIDLTQPTRPQLLWERELGEYTRCTKPILAGDTLIVALINAQGELWICGFSSRRGILRWSTYIGTSSFLSPVCCVSAQEGNKAYIGTNHGVLVCLDTRNGEVSWILKYTPRTYNLLEYFEKEYYKDKIFNKGSLSYDTQFITLDNNGRLYFKPRESDYLYTVDPNTGQIQDETLLDARETRILGILQGKAVFFREDTGQKDGYLKIIDLASSQEVYQTQICAGPLRGVQYENKQKMAFKIGNTVYFLMVKNNDLVMTKTLVEDDGWLMSAGGRYICLKNNQDLINFDVLNDRDVPAAVSPYAECFKKREKVKNLLYQELQVIPNRKQVAVLADSVRSEKEINCRGLKEFFPIVAAHLEKLRGPVWQAFMAELAKLYGDEIITYLGIQMRFNSFVIGSGLSNSHSVGAVKNMGDHAGSLSGGGFQAHGCNVSLLPVTLIKGAHHDILLLLQNNQLLCVNEKGDILWERKIFYRPVWYGRIDHDLDKRMFAAKIEAYLYENVLIINDHVNIIAQDALTGRYIWSMTNDSDIFWQEKDIQARNQDETIKKYGVDKIFLKHIKYNLAFIDDALIVMHDGKIYTVDPVTGYCSRYREVNMDGALDIKVSGNRLFIIPCELRSIKIFNKELEEVGELRIDFMDMSRGELPQIILKGDDAVVFLEPWLYVFNNNTGEFKSKFEVGDYKSAILDTIDDLLLLIEPYSRISSYHVKDGSVIPAWQFDSEGDKPEKSLTASTLESKGYFIKDGIILLPFTKAGMLSLSARDHITGRELWRSNLEGTRGLMSYLSEAQFADGIGYIIVSTICGRVTGEEFERCKATADANNCANLESTFLAFSLSSGSVTNKEKLPVLTNFDGPGSLVLTQTKHLLAYCFGHRIIKAMKK